MLANKVITDDDCLELPTNEVLKDHFVVLDGEPWSIIDRRFNFDVGLYHFTLEAARDSDKYKKGFLTARLYAGQLRGGTVNVLKESYEF